MSFAILRIAKLKAGNLHGSSSHITRSRETANADPARRHLNQTLIGEGVRPVDAVQACVADITKRRSKVGGRKLRSDAVLAVEYILTASPEHFAGKSQDEIERWAQHALQFLVDRYGKNVVSATLHLDESTPHLHVYHVPESIDAKNRPTLSAKHFYGSRALLSQLQTDYAEHMQAWDPQLKRGISKSKAHHKTVRQWYQEIQELPELKIPSLRTDEIALAVPPLMVREETRQVWAKAQEKTVLTHLGKYLDKIKKRLSKALRAAKHYKALYESERDRNAGYARLGEPKEIIRLIRAAKKIQAEAREALASSRDSAQRTRAAEKAADWWKGRFLDLQDRTATAERDLETICKAVGIAPDQVQTKAWAVERVFRRYHRSRSLDLNIN